MNADARKVLAKLLAELRAEYLNTITNAPTAQKEETNR